jgi:hypothetical protein
MKNRVIRNFELQLFAMSNPDTFDAEMQTKIKNALESADPEAFAKVQVEIAREIENRILKEAKAIGNIALNDQQVLAQRGLSVLTADEQKYYNEVITAGGFAGAEQLMPPTIFDRVFEDLKANHPLLSEIAFTNTTGVTEWITRENDAEAAWWGKLTAAIEKKLEVAFKKVKTELFKLSAYMPVSKSMLDLGPAWLDKFVRTVLAESMSVAIELAAVKGSGVDQPIGMIKNLSAAFDPVTGYVDKTAVALLDLDPKTLGKEVMAPLTKDGKRAVPKVLIIVNPVDYWEKIFPATTFLSATGTYVHGVLPIPATVIQSVAVEKGTLIAGMGKDYFFGVGSTQKIEFSDHYKFLDDERTYIAKQYANGKPVDNDSFLVFDISEMGEVSEV